MYVYVCMYVCMYIRKGVNGWVAQGFSTACETTSLITVEKRRVLRGSPWGSPSHVLEGFVRRGVVDDHWPGQENIHNIQPGWALRA